MRALSGGWALLIVGFCITRGNGRVCQEGTCLEHPDGLRTGESDLVDDVTLASDSQPIVLAVGGNGFIGSHTVTALVEAGYRVVLLNRNSTYYDISERVMPLVDRHIHFDRRTPAALNKELVDFLHQNARIHAVVDFSCFNRQAAEDFGTLLSNFLVDWYIYLSTDSVYEVCEKGHDGPTKEGDAVRPCDPIKAQELKAADTYGHGKLDAEDGLAQVRAEREGFSPGMYKYVFVRVPDVVGPRDTTYRWWMYQILIKLQSHTGIPIPLVEEDEKGRMMSLVYVRDIATAVVNLISDKNDKVINTAINIAGQEPISFKRFCKDLATEMRLEGPLAYALNDTTDLPSVKKGPVSVAKAEHLLSLKSTPWRDVLTEAVQFYEAAMVDPRFSEERDGALEMVYAQAARWSKQKELKEALTNVYGLEYTIVDELLKEEEEGQVDERDEEIVEEDAVPVEARREESKGFYEL